MDEITKDKSLAELAREAWIKAPAANPWPAVAQAVAAHVRAEILKECVTFIEAKALKAPDDDAREVLETIAFCLDAALNKEAPAS